MRFYINQLLHLTRFKKQLIMVGFDFVLLPFSLMLAYALRFNNHFPLNAILRDQWLFYLMPIIVIPARPRATIIAAALEGTGDSP